jgi:hypothetical protein
MEQMKRQRRLLMVSAVLMLLCAAVHTVGNMAPKTDPAEVELFRTMAAFHYPMGFGMNPSMEDAFFTLVLVMTVTFVALGVLNLALAVEPDITPRFLRRVIVINAIWVAAFTALSFFYRIPPPLISGIVIEIPLLIALILPGSEKEIV